MALRTCCAEGCTPQQLGLCWRRYLVAATGADSFPAAQEQAAKRLLQLGMGESAEQAQLELAGCVAVLAVTDQLPLEVLVAVLPPLSAVFHAPRAGRFLTALLAQLLFVGVCRGAWVQPLLHAVVRDTTAAIKAGTPECTAVLCLLREVLRVVLAQGGQAIAKQISCITEVSAALRAAGGFTRKDYAIFLRSEGIRV